MGEGKPGRSSEVLITIRDSGIGISKENIGKIFDRFYRVEGQWESDGSGSGIGLSLTREFVELLHGSIEVDSQPGAGSIFEIRIPLGVEHLETDEYVIAGHQMEREVELTSLNGEHNDLSEHDESQPGKMLSILVVEDNADLRTYITDNLEKEYQILEASNGKTGLSLAFSKIPDLIISDVIMPELGGIELCERLKNDERTSHIPVIMLTARTTVNNKIEGLQSGADEYIYKPFDINELKARISNLITQRERLRQRFGSLTGLEHFDHKVASLDERFIAR